MFPRKGLLVIHTFVAFYSHKTTTEGKTKRRSFFFESLRKTKQTREPIAAFVRVEKKNKKKRVVVVAIIAIKRNERRKKNPRVALSECLGSLLTEIQAENESSTSIHCEKHKTHFSPQTVFSLFEVLLFSFFFPFPVYTRKRAVG